MSEIDLDKLQEGIEELERKAEFKALQEEIKSLQAENEILEAEYDTKTSSKIDNEISASRLASENQQLRDRINYYNKAYEESEEGKKEKHQREIFRILDEAGKR